MPAVAQPGREAPTALEPAETSGAPRTAGPAPAKAGYPAPRLALHEWRLIGKEPRFLFPFFITPLFIVGFQAFSLYYRGGAGAAESLMVARSLLLMLAVLAPSLAVPLGADSFAGERERNTLEILLCLPVGVSSLFWGKVLGILPLPVLVGWLGQGLLLCVLALRFPIPPDFWPSALRLMGLTPAVGLFFSSLSALISLHAESVRGAAQACSLVMLALLFATASVSMRLFVSSPFYLASLAALAAGSALCLYFAKRRFQRLPL